MSLHYNFLITKHTPCLWHEHLPRAVIITGQFWFCCILQLGVVALTEKEYRGSIQFDINIDVLQNLLTT